MNVKMSESEWAVLGTGMRSNFRLSPAGTLHVAPCRWAVGGPLNVVHVLDHVLSGGKVGQCCGASPRSWIRTQALAFGLAEMILNEVSL